MALGNSLGIGPDGQACTSRAWVHDIGAWDVVAGKAVGTPTVGAELLTDPGLEANYTAGLCDSLTKGGSPTVAESADVHGGSKAQAFTATAQWNGLAWAGTNAVIGTWLRAILWAKRTVGAVGGVQMRLVKTGLGSIKSSAITSAGYAEYAASYRADVVGPWYVDIEEQYGAGDTVLIDDGSLRTLTLSSLFATQNVGSGDCHVDVKVSALTTGTQAGLVARLDSAASPANFIIGYFDGAGNVKLDECIAGTYASLASVAKAFTADDTLRLALSGAAWRLYHITSGGTAVLIGSGTTNRTEGNLHGLFSTYASNAFSTATVFPTGTGGEYTILDQLGA